jgi:hypothetical protein
MASKIRFFDSKTHLIVKELTVDVKGLDFTAGLHGSLSGNATIKVKAASESFLRSLKENSHFMTVHRDGFTPYGAVVEAAVINKGVCTLNFIGLYEFLDKMELMAAHKANAISSNTTIKKDDPSYLMQFCSDSPIGVFHSIVSELNETIVARGLLPFIDVGSLESFIDSTTSETFARVYRLNALEFPTVKAVIDKIFEDLEMDAITVDVLTGDTFGWVLGVLDSYNTFTISIDDKVRNITFEDSGDVSRSYSLATGTNLSGDTVVSKIDFDPAVAYTSFIANNPADKTSAIDRINRSSMADADKRKSQISFTVFNTAIRIQNVVEMTGPDFPLKKIVITQISVQNRNVTYTGQIVTDTSAIVKGITKPTNEARRMVYAPLGYATGTAKEVAFRQPGGTGWRA